MGIREDIEEKLEDAIRRHVRPETVRKRTDHTVIKIVNIAIHVGVCAESVAQNADLDTVLTYVLRLAG